MHEQNYPNDNRIYSENLISSLNHYKKILSGGFRMMKKKQQMKEKKNLQIIISKVILCDVI
jgi:hypothetical protein